MRIKYVFYFLWFCLVALPIYTVIKDSNLDLVFSKTNLTINFIQRISGLIVFTLLPVQILLGAYMTRLAEKFGSWIFWFHITQAIIIYTLILVHPVAFLILRKFNGGPLDPFYVFTDFCLLCNKKSELYLTFGRFGFVFLTLGYLAGKFRTITFLRKHWKNFHYFNYLGFFVIAFHGYKVGSDMTSPNFYWYFITAIVLVLIIFILRIMHKLRKK